MKKIAVITGSRADYGILYPLLKKLKAEKNIKLKLVVTGMHLNSKYGYTVNEIKEDGFEIAESINIYEAEKNENNSVLMGRILTKFSEYIKSDFADYVIILGDRFEIFAAAIYFYNKLIPIIHIHGGELSYGSLDDGYRHCITKLSTLHFTSTEEYKKRVIQMGENPYSVFNVGALGIDNIKNTKLFSKQKLTKELNLKFRKYNCLITYHPVTSEIDKTEYYLKELFKAFDLIDFFFDINLIFTYPNADSNNEKIIEMIKEYSEKKENSYVFNSLGRIKYLSMIKQMNFVIGNSSSGIIEVPFFSIPTINIGNRQEGRYKPRSVIDTKEDSESIYETIKQILTSKTINFDTELSYGNGETSNKMMKILLNLDKVKTKKFYDID